MYQSVSKEKDSPCNSGLDPLKAGFAQPSGVAYDPECDILYIADSESSSVRKLSIANHSYKAVSCCTALMSCVSAIILGCCPAQKII